MIEDEDEDEDEIGTDGEKGLGRCSREVPFVGNGYGNGYGNVGAWGGIRVGIEIRLDLEV